MERLILKQLSIIIISFSFLGCSSLPEFTQDAKGDQVLLSQDKKELDPKPEIAIEKEAKIEVIDNVWDYLKNNSSYEKIELNEKTLSFMNRHLRNLDIFESYLMKSEYFIYHIIKKLESENLPLELALIPFIESDYDPFSISASGAVGIWQFMPATGSLFNLNKTWWNEDRHDPFKSTDAAVGYFKYLLNRFDNDLYIAIAAYNGGPTYLDRQIRRNKRRGLDTDFFSLKLSDQSTEYVYKFIALRELIINSEQYEIKLPNINFSPRVVKIEVPGQVEILTMSDHLELKPELVYKLNAGYTKWASAPTNQSEFYIPIEKLDLFNNPENPINGVNKINWISHNVQNGDNLWDLAKKYDTEVSIIKQINYLNNDMLTLDMTLLIPLSKTKSNNFIPIEMHIVSEGDTLWGIADKYNITLADLKKMNNISNNQYLQLGQQLSIGNKNIHRNIESRKRTILYSVKQGDNLYKIADLFDVSVISIKEINKFKNSDLKPGQIIKIAIRAF
jgi:membrane-bound lytic murein transglycosylase D